MYIIELKFSLVYLLIINTHVYLSLFTNYFKLFMTGLVLFAILNVLTLQLASLFTAS